MTTRSKRPDHTPAIRKWSAICLLVAASVLLITALTGTSGGTGTRSLAVAITSAAIALVVTSRRRSK